MIDENNLIKPKERKQFTISGFKMDLSGNPYERRHRIVHNQTRSGFNFTSYGNVSKRETVLQNKDNFYVFIKRSSFLEC